MNREIIKKIKRLDFGEYADLEWVSKKLGVSTEQLRKELPIKKTIRCGSNYNLPDGEFVFVINDDVFIEDITTI